jgi:hypothetical protein
MYDLIESVNQIMLPEARSSNLTYIEKKVGGELDRVIVTLEGRESEAYTKLAKSFKRTKTQIERLQKVQEALNQTVKEKALELFNAEDEVLTRVGDTVSLGITISKKPIVQDTTKTDWEKVALEIAKLTPELDEKIQEIIAAYTQTKPGVKKDVSLRVDIKEGNGVVDFVWDKLKAAFSKLTDKMKAWGSGYDSKLAKVKEMM